MMNEVSIKYITGDATDPKPDHEDDIKMIVHICNDIGKWGKGFVMALSRRWDSPERHYRSMPQYILGDVQFVHINARIGEIYVANMIGQHGIYRFNGIPPIRYSAVRECLKKVQLYVNELKIITKRNVSIHMPRIGCGLAGGRWPEIENIIKDTLIVSGIDVYVYDLN